MISRLFSILLSILISLFASGAVLAQNIVTEYVKGFGEISFIEGEIIVRFHDQMSMPRAAALQEALGAQTLRSYTLTNAELWELRSISVSEALEQLRNDPFVKYAEPNFVFTMDFPQPVEVYDDFSLREQEGNTPNDPFFPLLWGLKNTGQAIGNAGRGTPGADIRAHLAWEIQTGSRDVIIAVLDSGIDYTHEDLVDNMWTDSNGNFGINTAPGTNEANRFNPMDVIGHGTHVAGTIGAVGNNSLGVTGVNWQVSLMAVKVFNNSGQTSSNAIIEGLQFAIDNGAQISNHSYGGYQATNAIRDAFQSARAANHLAIAAAGNDNVDGTYMPSYPANYPLDNIIAVASTDFNDQRSDFSNYGNTTVHIAAPGSLIGSTYPNNQNPSNAYQYSFGTSMASPHVAGVAGLILAENPDFTYAQIRDRILNRADRLPQLVDFVEQGRRLNAYTALLEDDGIAPATVTDLSATEVGQHFVTMTWTAVGRSGMEGKAARYEVRFSKSNISSGNFENAEVVAIDVVPLLAGQEQRITIRGLESGETYYVALLAEDYFGNKSGLSNVLTFETVASPEVQLPEISMDLTVDAGSKTTTDFIISNQGPGVLEVVTGTTFSPKSGATKTYRGGDNFAEFGALFQWEDVRTNGSKLSISNRMIGNEQVVLPFDFPFYGDIFRTAHVSVNGFLSFDPITVFGGGRTNRELGTGFAPHNIIAPYWANLAQKTSADSGIFTYHDVENNRFVIQWNNMSHVGRINNQDVILPGKTYTFQAVLYPDGSIEFHYENIEIATINNSVGIQNSDGTESVSFSFNTNAAQNGRSFSFVPDNMQAVAFTEGELVLNPGANGSLEVQANASALGAGTISTVLHLQTNDVNQALIRIPVRLTIEGESALVQIVHNSIDPQTVGMDIYINEQLISRGISFQSATPFLSVPANTTLEMSLANAESGDLPFNADVSFSANGTYVLIADGFLPPTPNAENATNSFGFFVIEDAKSSSDSGTSLGFFHGFFDGPTVSVEVSHQEAPITLGEHLTYGTFSGYSVLSNAFYTMQVSAQDLIFEYEIDLQETETMAAIAIASAQTNSNGVPLVYVVTSAGEVLSAPVATSGIRENAELPTSFALRQNYPNPFNPVTTISYDLPVNEMVRLEVYDMLGRRVAVLANEMQSAGSHHITFDANRLASGMYVYRIQAGSFVQTKKMMLIK